MPIMDGLSKFFVGEISRKFGLEEQDERRNVYVVKKKLSLTDEATGSEIILMPSDEYQITAMVDFGTKVLGTQKCKFKEHNRF